MECKILSRIDQLHKKNSCDIPIYNHYYKEILEYYRYELTDYETYGIGTGIGFEYVKKPTLNISSDIRLRNQRIMGFFSKDRRRLAKNLRIWLDVYRGRESSKAIESIKSFVSMGNPVIIEVNRPMYTEYLKKHKNEIDECIPENRYSVSEEAYWYSYMLVIIGLDYDNNALICLDSNLEKRIAIPCDELLRMNSRKDECFDAQFEWTLIIVPKHKEVISRKIAIYDSIKLDVYEMYRPYIFDDNYSVGVNALNDFCGDLESENLSETQFRLMMKSAYESSEVLNNNSGFFRKTYAKYLENASEYYPSLKTPKEKYMLLSEMWSDFLGQAVLSETSFDRSHFASSARRIMNCEKDAIESLKNALNL